MLQRTTCRLWHVKKGLPGVCASYSRLSPPSLPPRSSLSFVQLTTGRTQAIDLALRYHTGVNKGPDNGRAGRRILPLVQNLPNIGPSRHDTLSPAGSFDSPSLNYSGRRHFSAFPSVGPTGPGGSGPGGPGNFPWLGATIVLGGGALALVLLFALGKFILIGILFVGALLLMMKTTRSTSIGRHLSRSVGINPNSLTGKQILSSIVDSALIRLGKRMLADQYANLTFHGLLQQKLNESIAVQEKLGPVILTDFSKEDVYDEEPGIRVEGEIRNINGRIVGWLYSQSGVQEVSMLERKGNLLDITCMSNGCASVFQECVYVHRHQGPFSCRLGENSRRYGLQYAPSIVCANLLNRTLQVENGKKNLRQNKKIYRIPFREL
eukprot:gb/GECG01013128.1/.p1 GENE.gb/GECG01013128.1/~~gb/GECG01013128.1/.p1  ORF type:complete len:379 (+),score=23.23 gb/GECG01013128.1/:1-1137(+)